MPREVLRELDADVRRLLAAGAAVAPGDEGLGRRGEALRELGRQVPALAQVAAAVERVTASAPGQAAGPLLDLLLIVGQVRAGLAGAGAGGALAEIAPSGPWTTDAPAREIQYLLDAMASSGQRRTATLGGAAEPLLRDLRLLQPLLALWERADDEAGDLLLEHVLPQVGTAVLAEVWRALCQDRRKAAWRLLAVCRSHSALGLGLCQLALAGDDLMLRESAVAAVGQFGAGAASLVPALVRGLGAATGAERAMCARALGKIGPAARDAVPALCAALGDPAPSVGVAAAEALGQVRSSAALSALTAAGKDSAAPDVQRAARRAAARLQNPARGSEP